jgi:hypothetical protein
MAVGPNWLMYAINVTNVDSYGRTAVINPSTDSKTGSTLDGSGLVQLSTPKTGAEEVHALRLNSFSVEFVE